MSHGIADYLRCVYYLVKYRLVIMVHFVLPLALHLQIVVAAAFFVLAALLFLKTEILLEPALFVLTALLLLQISVLAGLLDIRVVRLELPQLFYGLKIQPQGLILVPGLLMHPAAANQNFHRAQGLRIDMVSYFGRMFFFGIG